MKTTKLILSALIALTTTAPVAALAQGGFTGSAAPRGGFTGPTTVLTAEQARSLRNDTKVSMRGSIERHLGGDIYLFRDASGTISVEIDAEKWAGQSVSPQDQIEIRGEVDKDWNSVVVDVDSVSKL